MKAKNWKNWFLALREKNEHLVTVGELIDEKISVYARSMRLLHDNILFIGKQKIDKFLFIVSDRTSNDVFSGFIGEIVRPTKLGNGIAIKRCRLSHENATLLRELFHFTRPQLIGLRNSIGLGDRLGLANPGHIRAIRCTSMRPVLAQQSIRELDRTQRSAAEVIDAASWAVFQEGYEEGFGADADHLKSPGDIDRMVPAGYTMITFDPGDYVINEADLLPQDELSRRIRSLPWDLLQDTFEDFMARYEGRSFNLADGFSIEPSREQILRAMVKYGGMLAHTVRLYRYLRQKYSGRAFEIELSVDETESVTSPFEHLLITRELKRLGIPLISLAPRFVGGFEKGIDYKGDLNRFKGEYLKHLKIARMYGPYKISFHSGSDKFRVYETVGKIRDGFVHIKTAGTSYLEGLRTVAAVNPELFREILSFARSEYEGERRSYHVSADVNRVPAPSECSDRDLLDLFEQDDARQVLHVTFGKVLTTRNAQGSFLFKDRLLNCLREHEEEYYANLERHFKRYVQAFVS